ncbi:hypothetical protein AC579_5075 [Pseudocercospora musae]|uniref:Uncharacterized protein n=1 Tax=Pseudocercospora musae TaxID=113226 RepID=A0A139INA9_9PEZI|nr:hypothetical protein AC579_5075 [Pseudocercospora musae]KXT16130.1 hypothetical protein AC579_5075 [Pseudocercospora musae]
MVTTREAKNTSPLQRNHAEDLDTFFKNRSIPLPTVPSQSSTTPRPHRHRIEMHFIKSILFLASLAAAFAIAPQTERFECKCAEDRAGKRCYKGAKEKIISGGVSGHEYVCYDNGACKDMGKKHRCKKYESD